MEHTCKLCGQTKPASEFYDYVTTRCKPCHKKAVSDNRRAKAEYYREYDALRFQNDPKVRERHRRYQKTEGGKASLQASREKWLAQNGDKRAAHVILGNAVRDGRIEKPKACSVCGAVGKLDGHHADYAFPLSVLWLCRKCHVELHRSIS